MTTNKSVQYKEIQKPPLLYRIIFAATWLHRFHKIHDTIGESVIILGRRVHKIIAPMSTPNSVLFFESYTSPIDCWLVLLVNPLGEITDFGQFGRVLSE